jgi:hypothetical protein
MTKREIIDDIEQLVAMLAEQESPAHAIEALRAMIAELTGLIATKQ